MGISYVFIKINLKKKKINRKKLIYVFIWSNKTIFIKQLLLIINNKNANLKFCLINLFFDLGAADYFIYNKNLFLKKI